jgi:hypothetical protein
MAITANMTTSEGVALTGAYLVIKSAYVKKFDGAWTGNDDDGYTQGSASFKLIYDVDIYLNADKRAEKNNSNNIIKNRHIDHHKCDYDLTASDNPFKLAYADLKTNSELSNVVDA